MKGFIRTSTLLLLLATNTLATDYYVSTKGDDKNTGTKRNPFLTIQKAADIMMPGDICYIAAGIYNESVFPKNSGTEDNPIIFGIRLLR